MKHVCGFLEVLLLVVLLLWFSGETCRVTYNGKEFTLGPNRPPSGSQTPGTVPATEAAPNGK